MSYLLDTNILLRFLLLFDPHYAEIRRAIRLLKSRRERLCTTTQNIAEFWNVCTRPTTARGGLGLTIEATKSRLQLLERAFIVLPESSAIYNEWKNLVEIHRVSGVQVHDARLVAAMKVHGVTNLITLNIKDFSRFSGITVIEPQFVE